MKLDIYQMKMICLTMGKTEIKWNIILDNVMVPSKAVFRDPGFAKPHVLSKHANIVVSRCSSHLKIVGRVFL